MQRTITVTFKPENEDSEVRLGAFPFVESTPGKHPVFSVGPTEITLPSGGVVTITAAWSPGNNMTSILVHRDGKLIGHSGSCWELGDPYLGLHLQTLGFLHFYYGKSDEK